MRELPGVRISPPLWTYQDVSHTLLNSKVILKYALLHFAELLLLVGALIVVERFLGMGTWLIITIIVLWIVKDIIMFTKVWQSYAFPDNDPMRQLIGLEATVMVSLNPVGYVRTRGELWKAEVSNPRYPVEKGARTRVIDVKGTTLIVERCDGDGPPTN